MLRNDNGSYLCVQLQHEVRPLATSMSCETGALCEVCHHLHRIGHTIPCCCFWGYLESNGVLYTYDGEDLLGAEDASKLQLSRGRKIGWFGIALI